MDDLQSILQPLSSHSMVGASECRPTHDVTTLLLSSFLCIGLVISYLPQHLRIIRSGTSEGFSPWYLLLGATSSASGLLNLLILQWPLIRCCRYISGGMCFESLLGLIQVILQWGLFTIILILYLLYFPRHLKYFRVLPIDPTGSRPGAKVSTTPEWRLATTLATVVALHLTLLLALSLFLLTSLPATHPLLHTLATFLGLSGTVLAILQYAPQIVKTYRAKHVGALSIGTMIIQVPGSVAFVLSIALRPGADWTSWLPYAVTGAMQGALLVICILWKRRQAQQGLDDFGKPLAGSDPHETIADLVPDNSVTTADAAEPPYEGVNQPRPTVNDAEADADERTALLGVSKGSSKAWLPALSWWK